MKRFSHVPYNLLVGRDRNTYIIETHTLSGDDKRYEERQIRVREVESDRTTIFLRVVRGDSSSKMIFK